MLSVRSVMLFLIAAYSLVFATADDIGISADSAANSDTNMRSDASIDRNESCVCEDGQLLDDSCCPCTVSQVALATRMYFKERLQRLVETPLFKVYTPYPDYPGKELYDVECSIPEFAELAHELSELQLGCAIEQCGCARDQCDTEAWRHEPCFKRCEGYAFKREKSVRDIVMTAPVFTDNERPAQYDLLQNPEQFTGYGTLLDDRSAALIWESLYSDKFCFASCPTGLDVEPIVEKRLVYKVVSGLQASINTHIAMHYGFYRDTQKPATRENWGASTDLHFRPWQALFDERVGRYPDRIRNLHFVFALLTRALHRLQPHMDRLLETGANSCSKCSAQHNHTRDLLHELLTPPDHAPSECSAVLQAFDGSALFRGHDDETSKLKQEVKTRFERMGNLMTCVGCDRCKLWGTLQFHAVRVAFGILLAEGSEGSGNAPDQFAIPLWADLKPNDIVALVNALAQVSKSIDHVKYWMDGDLTSHLEL